MNKTPDWQAICVFAGSNSGTEPAYSAAAAQLGEVLGRQGLKLVFGAGSVGLMGVAADAALAAGGYVEGVIPTFLARKELLHSRISHVHITPDMHTRKAKMAELSDAFIALPGGLGTFEELFEVLTWAQLGVHQKPIGLLNVAGFFDPLVQFVEHAIDQGFIHESHQQLLIVRDEVDSLLHAMRNAPIPERPKWLELDET